MKKLATLNLILLFNLNAKAFPDLIRHNYVNCNTCHVSPTGAGTLTPYGRSLSSELLSQFGNEKEASFLHGSLGDKAIPEWLVVGGNVRVLQVHKETPYLRMGATIPMQADLEIGFVTNRITSVASFGKINPTTHRVDPEFSKYFLMWNPIDELNIRTGLFTPAFGIPIPYHTMATRDELGLGRNSERELHEVSWSGEQWSTAISYGKNSQKPNWTDNSLLSMQVNRNLFDSSKVGFSYMTNQKQSYFGIHTILSLNEHLVYLTEFDISKEVAPKISGLLHFSQLLWEYKKGVNLYIIEDYAKTNLQDSQTLSNSFGPGLRYHPRPHFDLDFAILKKRVAAVADRYDNLAWLQGHYYF